MTDLRAERRAIVERFFLKFGERAEDEGDGLDEVLCAAYRLADAIIQHDIDNPPEWEKKGITAGEAWQHGYDSAKMEYETNEGWTHHTERLPTEADAPDGRIHISNKYGNQTVCGRDTYSKYKEIQDDWPYWHPATGRFCIPKAPEVKS